MEAGGSAPTGPSGSGGMRGAGEAGRGVASGSAPIASFSTPDKDDVEAFNLEKYSGEDWASWSFRMELLVNHCGLLEVMDGELKRHASEGATKEWDRRSNDGFFLLSQCLSSNQLHHVKHLIKDIQCGPKAWKILKDVHNPSSQLMVVVLERELHTMKINEGDDVQGAFVQLRDLYVKLSAAGVDYPEKIKCYKALSLLPESFSPWWKELTAAAGEGGGSAYSMEGFKGRGSKKGKAKEGSGGEQYSGGKRGNKGGKRCGGKCWYCHVQGHPWFKCRKLPGDWRPGQSSIKGSKGVHGAMGEGMDSEEGDGGAGGHGGPMKVKGDGGALYFMTMVDDYTRLTWSFPLAKKSDAARVIIEEWLPIVERESGKQVKAIRSDRRGEFLGAEFRSWLKRHGIKQQLTTAYTPQSNGVAERENWTIIECGRTIFVDSDLPLRFWPLAIRHATVIKNRVLTHVGGQHWVPMEKWSGKKPLVDMLRVFGCMGLMHVPKEKRDKLQAVAVWAVHLATAVCGWKVEQMDVKTAFLYGVVDEEIYMKQPEGYDDGSGHVCRLNKAIYGLKQAPRCWYARLVEALEALGFKVSECDESLFMTEGEEEKVFFLVYVDDILLLSPSLERIKEVQGKLEETFQCKALGPVGYYLGLHVERDEVNGWLRLHQHKYLAAMDERYGLEEGRSVKTPLPSRFQLHLDEEEGEVLEPELHRRFQSIVGSLMYASVNTRPDIAFSVSQLACVVSRPRQEHLDAAERLVRYCMATSRVGLQYSVHGHLKQKGVSTKIGAPTRRGHLYLSCFTDATWASDISDATSHGGYICCVGGSPVSWKSKKQGEIAHSSIESEYMALFHGVKEVVWMRRLLEELGQEKEGPTPVFCNSQGAIAMASNAVLHRLNKHMHIKWHWVRKEVKIGTVSLHYINTTKQPAYFLTKQLAEH
ncbi:unnamed protein product [Closterium sp. NIES-54]